MRTSLASLGKVFALFTTFYLGAPASVVDAEASCRHGIGVSRTVNLSTNGGARFGSSHGGHRNFLRDKEVVLTFDDGPVPGKTKKVLQALQKHCTKATFFMVGRMAANNPGLVKQVLAGGHTVGTHSYSHRNLGQTNSQIAVEDVTRSIRAIDKATGGKTTAFFRFPYLSENTAVNALLKRKNIGVFAIDVDSLDYKFTSPSSMINRVMSELNRKGRGIILLHDIQNVTANGIDQLLTRLDGEGYRVVHIRGTRGGTVDEPLLLASNEVKDEIKKRSGSVLVSSESTANKRIRSASLKRPKIKNEKPTIRSVVRLQSKKKTQEEKPKKVRVAGLSSRQREIIKKRQRVFKERLAKNRNAFRSVLKNRLITQ